MAGPILIMAGGTGGHVFPALAVAELLRRYNDAQGTQWIIQGTPLSLRNGEVFAYPVGPEA